MWGIPIFDRVFRKGLEWYADLVDDKLGFQVRQARRDFATEIEKADPVYAAHIRGKLNQPIPIEVVAVTPNIPVAQLTHEPGTNGNGKPAKDNAVTALYPPDAPPPALTEKKKRGRPCKTAPAALAPELPPQPVN